MLVCEGPWALPLSSLSGNSLPFQVCFTISCPGSAILKAVVAFIYLFFLHDLELCFLSGAVLQAEKSWASKADSVFHKAFST